MQFFCLGFSERDLPKSPLLFQDFHQFTLELLVKLYLFFFLILSVNLLSNLKQMKNVAPCQEIWKHMLCFLDILLFFPASKRILSSFTYLQISPV